MTTIPHKFIRSLNQTPTRTHKPQGRVYEDVEFIDKRAYGVYTPTFAWHMAKFVCHITDGTNRQIEHPETVVAIAKFFRETEELPICREKYDKVVQAMAKVIQAGERDLCAPEKIDAVVNFHKSFLSKSSSESVGAEIPKLLNLFYLKYAFKISKTCKNQVLEHIESPKFKKAEIDFSQKAAALKELDRIIGEYSTMSSSISGSIKSFYNIDLLWAVIDRSPLEPELEGVLTAPSAANNFKRVNLATSGSEKILKVQRQCESLKPYYESPFLNTIRLIDLGYYLEDEPFARTLSKRPNLMRIIGLVIICETLLPMRVIQDDSLSLDESKFVKIPADREQVVHNQLDEADNNQPRDPQVFQPPPYSIVEPMTDKEIKHLKGNIKSRDNKRKLMLRGYLRKIKIKFKSFFGSMFHRRDPNRGEDITKLLDVFK